MTTNRKTTLQELGEFGLIKRLTGDWVIRNKSTLKGVGDDAAVLDYPDVQILVTSDLLVEGIHFDLTYVPLKHLGYKSVVVNLSDIYAMNGKPGQVIVNLALSARFSLEAVEELYKGIKLACTQYDVDLAGGDTSTSMTGLMISVTAIGYAPKERIVYRDTARKGDLICVTGDLGAAYMGLMLLQREKRLFEEEPSTQPKLNDFPYILERQLKPEARHDIIARMNQAGVKPSAMIDLSDGLSSDLLHICHQSKTGCRVYADKIPIQQETEKLANEMLMSPVVAALNGGEDYELLFTLPQDSFHQIQSIEGITVIGHLVDEDEGHHLIMSDSSKVPLVAQGWNAMDKNEEPAKG